MTDMRPYIQIARPDHWTKNVFMLPGVALAFYDDPALWGSHALGQILVGLLSFCLLASSNYVLNEILDAPMDRYHPVKKNRPIPSGRIYVPLAYVEWILIGLAGLGLAWTVNAGFFFTGLTLLVMGLLYNVPPVRLKDTPYLDVLSESANNPIRLLAGWYCAGDTNLIMASAVMSYWMLGAFLMAMKRYAEFIRIGSDSDARKYRKSFAHYTRERLLTNIVYYATAFGLFGGIFLVRYHIELILCVPLVAGFIAYYLKLGFIYDSPVQYPERLYKERGFIIYSLISAIIVLALLFVDIPFVPEFFAGRPR
jgi:decaprenyl-phosphate phosphoribosyltransferase